MSKQKDPAVLWYYQDYLQGTEEMSWAEQGAYARLLNKQADKGHLSAEMVAGILKKDGPKLWPKIKHKFVVDENGNFYNERMELEIQKRRRYSGKQRDRINAYWDEVRSKHGNTVDKTTVSSTEHSTVIPIENGNGNTENQKWNARPDSNLKIELTDLEIGKATEYVAGIRQVTLGPPRIRVFWAAFVANLTGEDWYYTRASLIKHFREWLKKQPLEASPMKIESTADALRKAREKHNNQ